MRAHLLATPEVIALGLLSLERTAEEERARLVGVSGEAYDEQWQRWRVASEAVQAAITAYAKAAAADRYDAEQAVKRAVCHGQEKPGNE